MKWSGIAAGVLGASAALAAEKRDVVCVGGSGPSQIIQIFISTNVINIPIIGGDGSVGTTTSTVTNTATTTLIPGDGGVTTTIAPVVNVINFPVVIDTFIQQNTIINNQGATIIVNNAPTSIFTTATGTSTVTETVTSIAQPTSTFILQPTAAAVVKRSFFSRRQDTAIFVAGDGSIVSSCAQAARYSIADGRLFVDGSVISTNVNTTSIVFAPQGTNGTIQTTFSVAAQLAWTNAAFVNGAAVFNIVDNELVARFDGLTNGQEFTLASIDASACQDGTIVTSSTTTSSSTSTTDSSSSTSTTDSSSTTTADSSTTTDSTTTVLETTTSETTSTESTTTTLPVTL